MKKIISVIMLITMVFTLAGCSGAKDNTAQATPVPSDTPAVTEATTVEPTKEAAPLDWPKNNINMIITHGAGGDTDYNARLISRLLEEKLGVTVVPTNVTGSNGAIALEQYKDENPDGYTFVLTNTAALTGNEATGLSEFGYDAFEPVCVYGKQAGENIIVPANSPYNTLQELIDASIAKPDTIKFGISTGGGIYVASVILEKASGTKFAIMESGDAATRLTDLLGGHIDVTIAPYSVAKEYIEAGQVKSLCTLLEERPTLISEVPTANESGAPELILNTLYACLAPKGTDPLVVEALNAAIKDIVENNAEYKEEVNSYNFQEPWALNVDETKAELESQRMLFMKYADYLQ